MTTSDINLDVPDSGAVFAFGKNVPPKFYIRNDTVVAAACGEGHAVVVTSSGRVFGFGQNDYDQPVKTGHYARMSTGNLGPGQYNFKDGVADLNRPEKRNHGKFLKMVQYPAKPCDRIYWMTPATVPPDPTNKVSAASYHPTDPNFKKESFSKSEAGFLSTSNRQDKRSLMFFTKNFNQVGPGRYDVQRQEDTAHVNAHTNDFVSKTEARLSHGQQQVYRERLRDKDIPPGRRFRVDHVATEKEPFVNIQPLFAARDPLVIQ